MKHRKFKAKPFSLKAKKQKSYFKNVDINIERFLQLYMFLTI